jgi:peptide-methionine (S)-S-oxide reductase
LQAGELGLQSAEDYHQLHLCKVPHGYCPDHSTGVSCPVGLNLD